MAGWRLGPWGRVALRPVGAADTCARLRTGCSARWPKRTTLGFTIAHGKIIAIDVLADPERLIRLGAVAG